MRYRNLIYKNITYYARYYKLIAAAVTVTVAVITGSLVVGDSVRTSLVKRVYERLGDTETIIFSRNSFMDARLPDAPLFDGAARGILLTNGFIPCNGKLIPVFVWGVNDMSVARGSAMINRALAEELVMDNPAAGDIVLRLPATGLVPSGSLFVTGNYTASMRLVNEGIVESEEGGNVSMKNEQLIPLNIFVNREEMAETMGAEGKINLILAARHISDADFATAWNYSMSGLSVNRYDGFTEITADRIFLQKEVVAGIAENNNLPNRLFSYLANSIEYGGVSIPYSFVTAMDSYRGEPLRSGEAIISDYAARRIQAKEGNLVRIAYFTSRDLKTLTTDTVCLQIKKIVPLDELLDDKTLSAEFPGLSDVESCTDWDSDLPVDMSLITPEDEKYWEEYRNTPKALIAYESVADGWGNAYGNATAVRVTDTVPELSVLSPEMFGIQLVHPREAGLYAASNGVSFSELFLALGFFIIVSAILLMLVPLSEMLYRRRYETDMLKALGYIRKRIARLLWAESFPVVAISSVAGVIAGLLYTAVIVWLLGSVWKGATHTGGFSVYPGVTAVSTGLVAGIVLSLGLLRIAIVRTMREKPHDTRQKKLSLLNRKVIAIAATVVLTGITFINIFILQSVILFVITGIAIIATAAVWGDYLICRNGLSHFTGFTPAKMMWNALFANKRQVALSFFALASGVFIVFSVGLNRKGFADSSQIRTGTGGYSLWCESSVPVYYNMATEEGREQLSLTGLPPDTEILQCLRYAADEASCLNLHKVINPTVLGVDMETLASSDFRIEQSLFPGNREDIFRRMKERDGVTYPALVDATVLTWSLGMNIGDTLWYEGDRGQRVAIRLMGTLSNSVFQGHILTDRRLFPEIWDEITGSEVFLLKTGEQQREEVQTLLSQALSEYGVRVITTNDRLRQFNTVTDTYLTIFFTLGGLGLLLGIAGFVIVVRKNLAARHDEIRLYSMLGFPDSRIERILKRENSVVPLYAIATGIAGSLAAAGPGLTNAGLWVWLLALLFTIGFVWLVMVFVSKSVKSEVSDSVFSVIFAGKSGKRL